MDKAYRAYSDAYAPAGDQKRIEFTPTASTEENHRKNQRQAILLALRMSPLTAVELFGIAGPGFSSRISELRKEGYLIVTRMIGRRGIYSLEKRPTFGGQP